jgi:iron complex outermembrane receptor protein
VPRDPQNVDRIEIIKGPSSFLYGSGDPAGIVNVVTKKPLANQSFATAGYTFGSFQTNRYILDANSNVTQSGDVIARVNVAQEDSLSYIDFNYLNRTDVTPVVTWLMNPSTTLTWQGEYHKDNRIGFQGTPAVNGDPLALPAHRFVGQPGVDGLRTNEFRQSLVLTHQLDDNWSFNIGGYSLFYQFPGNTTSVTQNPGFLPPLSGPFFYQTQTTIPFENEQTQSMIANLAGDFYTGALRHRSVIGMEYVYFDSNSQFISSINPFPIDVNNPPTGPNPPQIPFFNANFPVFRQQRVGGYMLDYIDITPTIKGIAGVRFDTLAFDFERNLNLGPGTASETQQTFNRTTPRAGLVYLPFADETLNFYYNYSQSFTPPGGGIFLNPVVKPILGQGHEAGIKTQILPNLALNACGYRIMRFNDEFNTSSFAIQQVGEVRSQGADLNLIGSITDYWNVIGNYTYADARLFDATQGFNGQNARNVPFNTANIWTRYNFVQNDVATLGAGIGVYYLGSRAADLQNTLDLPAFNRWDAGLYYTRGRLNATLYFFNIFNRHYDLTSINTNQILQGSPAGMRGMVTWTF